MALIRSFVGTVTSKLLTGALLIVSLCFAVTSVVAYLAVKSLAESDLDALARNATATARSINEDIRKNVSSYADLLGRKHEIAVVVASGDAGALEKTMVSEYQALKKLDQTIATVEVTDAKGVVIMRGHNPGKKGDNKSALPMIQA